MDNRVFVAKCDGYEKEKVHAAVGRMLDAFGGAAAILAAASSSTNTEKKKVLVKPNLLMPHSPEAATTTHPAVVEAVCAEFVKAGAEVTLIDSTGGPHTKIVLNLLYGKTGMKEAAKQSGAKVSYNTKVRKVNVPDGKTLSDYELLAPVLEADLVISAAKVKTHGFQAMTGCVKNLFGCIPGMMKPYFHRKYSKREEFASMLVDNCEFIKPGFSILDGIYGMEGAGPSGGEKKFLGALIGGVSPYAVDLAQCHLMGMRVDNVYTLVEAAGRALAPIDCEELRWLGDDPSEIRTAFKPATSSKNDEVPGILDKCTGCGDCSRICPMQCIEIREKRAVINPDACIRCYCCHEFCKVKAIMLG